MKNTGYFKNKKITVIGLARSGLACANLLSDLGAEVSITDNKDTEQTRGNAARLKSSGIKVELGKHTPGYIEGRDLVVISPGVPWTVPPVVWARESHIPVISEIEVAWRVCPATIIAVTGSNGKTTTTTLIGKILEASGKRVFVCGNIGTPFSGEVAGMSPEDYVSLEVSSFQMEAIEGFKPKISVILNLTANHLDRYKTMDEYAAAKKRIFMNQDASDFAVLNGEDKRVRETAGETKAAVRFFSGGGELNPDYEAVMTVGELLGVNKQVCLDVFKNFKGLEHRMEFVSEFKEVTFINDSKATTVDSALWALRTIKKPVILIAGGRHKGVDYTSFLVSARGKVKKAVLIGEARELIRGAFSGVIPLDDAVSLEDAVHKAFASASPGDCVLLSPMCSSYDMFRDYEERGREFKRIVNDLLKKSS
ncbi:MAG: UDP-N-acetylmuramoyl-L-alanine--D-glutamate ligase [Candidatus Omnitrophica bacterium]|nr:UDP-N-acetylmuramoyl-L-alanine--D-glutamate ligase [Candidatus Omnitrophota bacterium]